MLWEISINKQLLKNAWEVVVNIRENSRKLLTVNGNKWEVYTNIREVT